ncbi:sulfotransferase family 2 domain-containing protein [Lysinibacillus sphaericus]
MNKIKELESYVETLFSKPVPIPLYNKDFPLILFWSPKAGCTSFLKWFLYQNGLLEEALNYNSWPHAYRLEVLNKRPEYVKGLRTMLINQKKPVYKLVRNPYTRAVSSYVAALRTEEISNNIQLQVNNGISFKEYLYHIKKKGVGRDKIDLHIAKQFIAGEKKVIKNYLKLEEFKNGLRKIEKNYSMKAAPINDLIKSPHHNDLTLNVNECFSEKKFTGGSLGLQLPSYNNFYDGESQELVYEIFKADFIAYDYGKNIPGQY